MNLVIDIEANNLLTNVSTVWIIVCKVLNEDKWFIYTHHSHPEKKFNEYPLEYFENHFTREDMLVDTFIGHNIISYDTPVLNKLVYPMYDKVTGEPKVPLLDTLVMSRVLNPDRGGHSLQDHMIRWGGENQKVKNEDWSKFHPIMLERCKSDVLATEKLYNQLIEEIEYDENLLISHDDLEVPF